VKIRSFHFSSKKIGLCCAAVIASLFAAVLVSNVGFSSMNAFAQGPQNATQQQQEGSRTFIDTPRLDNFAQKLRNLTQSLDLNTTSTPEKIRDAVQAFMSSPRFAEFQQKVSQFAQEGGMNVTRLEQVSPNGNITNALQNFTQLIGQSNNGNSTNGMQSLTQLFGQNR